MTQSGTSQSRPYTNASVSDFNCHVERTCTESNLKCQMLSLTSRDGNDNIPVSVNEGGTKSIGM